VSEGRPTSLQRIATAARGRTPYRVHNLIARAAAGSDLVRRAVAHAQGDLRHADVTIAHGVAAGLRINSAETVCGYARGIAEPAVQETFAELLAPGMTMYDVGANIGFFTLIAAHCVGPDGRVIAIEPLPGHVRWLRHNAALNGLQQVEIIQAAAGATSGRTAFASRDAPVWGQVSATGELEVELIALDDRIESGALPVPDVVKLDVEGGEVDALAGLEQTLARHRPTLIVEVLQTLAAVTAALTAAGYAIERLGRPEPDENAHLIARPPR